MDVKSKLGVEIGYMSLNKISLTVCLHNYITREVIQQTHFLPMHIFFFNYQIILTYPYLLF